MTLVEVNPLGGGVTEIVFNRPEKLNALNADLLDEFDRAVAQVDRDPDTRCVLLRGNGGAFSVGYDVAPTNGHHAASAYDDWARLRRNLQRWLAVWDLEKPVIAAVHGYCAGGASMLCVCADITIVADDATISWPTVPLGGGLLSPVSLWLVGLKQARELSYLVGSSMTGAEATALGWANRSVPADRVTDVARDLAERIARTPSSLLRIKKLALNRVMETQGFRSAFMYGAEWDAIAHTVPEHTAMRAVIAEKGLKESIAWFRAGGDLTPKDPVMPASEDAP